MQIKLNIIRDTILQIQKHFYKKKMKFKHHNSLNQKYYQILNLDIKLLELL